jgi:predicted phage-related endonuclease
MPIERVPRDDQHWASDRLRFVNASESAIVCGEGAWGSLAELYAEKKGLRPPREDSTEFRRGRYGEAAAFEALADQYRDWEIKRAAVHVRDESLHMACTPDGYGRSPDRPGIGLIETKCVAQSIFRQRWLDDPSGPLDGPVTPPRHYRIQVAHQWALHPEVSWAVLAVLICGEWAWNFRLIEIEHDPLLEDRIRYCTQAFFHNYLVPGVMPPFEPQRDEALIKALYPKDNGTTIDLCADNRALTAVEELTDVQAALKRMQGKEKELKTELTGKLGDATFAVLGDGRCLSWKLQHSKPYSVPVKEYRVLRILKSKPEDDE